MTDPRAATSTGPDSWGRDAFHTEDLTGRELAGCRVLRKLGAGAMGAVYLAEQNSLRRTVALKVLDPKFSRDITYIERFEREAQAAARLTHYNIVQVFDYGRDQEIYYILNEYVDGGTVQEVIEAEGVLSPERALDIVLQAATGLAVAEANAVIHRDIKPENLMLTRKGVVKIADFGLAKVVSDDAAVTQSGMIVGTPFYMSPEQAKGLELDHRSDIYSLGIAFFYMTTGQIPFDADSVIGVLLKQISAERPDPCGINPLLPSPIGQAILKMMAKEPQDRHQTFDELRQALQELQDQLRSGTFTQQSRPAAAESRPVAAADRSERYKLLRPDRIILMKQRDVSTEAAKQMMGLLKGDAGVFIRSATPFPENSIAEVRFSVPGRDGLYRGIGVVRWTRRGDDPGMGITFLKVSTVPHGKATTTSERAQSISVEAPKVPQVDPAQALQALTETPLHCRLMRYYYANTGQSVELRQIGNALGVGVRMLPVTLRPYQALGLIRKQSSGLVELIWPEDKDLQQQIVNWVSKYGLL